MANLRATGLIVRNSTTIEVTFTISLDLSIGSSNITISGAGSNAIALVVSSISISNKILTIITQPMIPGGQYELVLASTTTQPFQSTHGDRLIEDGATNHFFFTGAEEESDTLQSLEESLPSIYDPKAGSFLYDLIVPMAREIEAAKHAANEVGAANYISVEVIDAEIVRNSGPYDRFPNEGVFKLLRVGATPTSATTIKTFSYTDFPYDPISLQQDSVLQETVSNVVGSENGFDGLLISLLNGPVIIVSSVVLIRNLIRYTYDLETYRYGVLESKYDSSNAYPAFDIADNQIRLSTSAVGPSFPLPQGNDEIEVSYTYKKLGRIPSSSSVTVTTTVSVSRESAPAVSTSFFLGHAPIVNQLGGTITTGGVQWLDPSTNFNILIKHPAFITEIPFNESSLPSSPGEFSVNYSTGQVIVFGVDGTGTDGTTVIPPVATYWFLRTFQDGLDYNLFSDLWELAAVSGRDLEGSIATISFLYEEAFAEDTDFLFASHVEKIDERVENRLISNFGLKTLYSPINEVFRIFNETTGELYKVSRISGNQVFFEASTPPVLVQVNREAALFNEHVQAQIVISDELIVLLKPFVVFKVELQDSNIASATNDYIGASFNSSLTFSDTTAFAREIFFDPDTTEGSNLQRLQQVGDYMVNYGDGIAYVAVLSGSSTDIGDASYNFGQVRTINKHIVEVANLYRSADAKADNIVTFNIGTIGDETIAIQDLEQVGESDIDGNPILVVSNSSGNSISVAQNALRVRHIFQVTDLRTSGEPVDFALGSIISSSQPTTITFDPDGTVIVDAGSDGTGLEIETNGSRKFVEVSRLSGIVSGVTQLAQLVNRTSDPSFLQREYWIVDFITGENYFSIGNDGYIDAPTNRIYLPSGVPNSALGAKVEARYRAELIGGAAVLVDYTSGDIFIDYTYVRDEILVSYEYGDNILDWSVSNSLTEGTTYYTSYRYGALRNALRDNFGVLTSIDELATAPLSLERELYRAALSGSLQSFLKGPTIPAIKALVKAFTAIDPTIEESAFFEWILGRDYLNLLPLTIAGTPGISDAPIFAPGKFGYGLLLNDQGQTATLPATSNMRFAEGTWECQLTPLWMGIDNDAELTFDILFDGYYMPSKIFIGSSGYNPETIPFTIDRSDSRVLGCPLTLHSNNGYFIWYDSTAKQWRLRVRAPILEERFFEGIVTSSGQFGEVLVASSADGYGPDDGYGLDEINDFVRSTDSFLEFSFIVDGYDLINLPLDSYGDGYYAALDGVDFQSDNVRYLFDTGVETAKTRMSLYKDGRGFLRYKVYDSNGRIKMISKNIRDWEAGDTHAVATSWKIGTVEQRDEIHLFVDGREVPNTYRFSGYLPVPSTGGVKFMDSAGEILLADAYATVGDNDMVTTAGSNQVRSIGATFVTDGVRIGDQFTILDQTTDGTNTRISPFVFVSSVVDENTLELEIGPVGSGISYLLISTLIGVNYSVNRLYLATVSDPLIEKIRIYVVSPTGTEVELRSPNALEPDYSFYRDGYQDYIFVNNGVPIGWDVVLYSYGLTQQRTKQLAYIWPYKKTNLINTIMPQPTAVSKMRITNIITRRINIDAGAFVLIATLVGGHIIQVLSSNLSFCQPSNSITGRRLSATIMGDNFDFSAFFNQITISGNIHNGTSIVPGGEVLSFSDVGTEITTQFFTSITSISAAFTPIDVSRPAGALEIREKTSLTQAENNGDYAQIRLSVIEQVGSDGILIGSQQTLTDGYARFGVEDINKLIYVETALPSGQVFIITDVPLDPSGLVKDSDTVVLSGVPPGTYSGLRWRMLNLSFSDSGFANGLITLETANSGGLPFLLSNCWYEIDFPSYAIIPWEEIPGTLYIGSDMESSNQIGGVIDEMHILGEMLTDTGIGEILPSSSISITSEANSVRELTPTIQSLALFHFNGCLKNRASFYSGFSQSYFQSSNSVNSLFNQSAVFNGPVSLAQENRGIFFNNGGNIEFWISPILDTYNDPTRRYYIDLSAEQTVESDPISALVIQMPVRARSISSVTLPGLDTNFFTGGLLDSDGVTIHLGLPIPIDSRPTVTYVPITSQGDRFSIFKEDNGSIVLLVTASGVDYQISAPVFWKKNTWHRIVVGWSLNNPDNQDRLVLMVDGTECGVIRYGTGFRYGSSTIYGMPTVWGQARAGTIASRNILADINMTDFFSVVHIGSDYTNLMPAMACLDNIRFSNQMRSISYLGGSGPGQLIGHDLIYTSNINTAQPVIEDALTTLLLDFDTESSLVEYLVAVHDAAAGIFDFFVTVIDSFNQIPNQEVKDLIEQLINRLKPAHTRAFVDFGDSDDC
jgi:hypothetical protein